MKQLVILLFLFTDCCVYAEKVLCADIGGTRIKSAVLSARPSLEEIRHAIPVIMPSNGWLSGQLPMLFSLQCAEGLCARIMQPYDRIEFGITGPVKERATYVNRWRPTIPAPLAALCAQQAGLAVGLDNDTVVWARGAFHLSNLLGNEVQFPCLVITLGTGVGALLMRAPDDMTIIEVGLLDIPMPRCESSMLLGQQVINDKGRLSSWRYVSDGFFKWADQHTPPFAQDELATIYHERVAALCNDITAYCADALDSPVKTVMIGGGNARRLDFQEMHERLSPSLILFNQQMLQGYAISPDMVSLVGCACSLDALPTNSIPSIEEMEQM